MAQLIRYPWRRLLEGAAKDAGLELTPDEAERVVRMRNDLVHRACYPDTSTYGSRLEQFEFLKGTVGRFLLAGVGWS